jgi:hypothetical protein
MPQPILYVAVTNHGFGHATRSSSVISEIQRLCPEVVIILVTTAPRWLLESYISADFIHRLRAYDVGVLQSDSLTMDKQATLERLQNIQSRAASITASEAAFIRQNRAKLVLADIPPLATSIAHAAEVPCWMMSNFGWDFIYRAWGEPFADAVDWISQQFSQCDRLFRLPFHEPMSSFPVIEDVGLTGGNPRYEAAELRSQFGLELPIEQTVLLTFGGLGLTQIPYHNLARYPDWQFITFDQQAPPLPNLLKVTDKALRPVDFMPVCSRIVSKPGYGTFAEACRMQVPIISITREDFAEAPILLESLQQYAHHRIVNASEFFEGDWEFLEQPMRPPNQVKPLATNGNEVIAQAVIEYLHKDN